MANAKCLHFESMTMPEVLRVNVHVGLLKFPGASHRFIRAGTSSAEPAQNQDMSIYMPNLDHVRPS